MACPGLSDNAAPVLWREPPHPGTYSAAARGGRRHGRARGRLVQLRLRRVRTVSRPRLLTVRAICQNTVTAQVPRIHRPNPHWTRARKFVGNSVYVACVQCEYSHSQQ